MVIYTDIPNGRGTHITCAHQLGGLGNSKGHYSLLDLSHSHIPLLLQLLNCHKNLGPDSPTKDFMSLETSMINKKAT